MSAPPSGSASGSPSSGYYPDPSIPGYIRYWNGSAWVPGTSRPEPREGEQLPTPPSESASAAAPSAPTAAEPAPAEETGPVFLDQVPGADGSGGRQGPDSQPPSAWQADASRQSGPGGARTDGGRVSWGQGGGSGDSSAAPGAPDASAGGPAAPGRGQSREGTVQMRAMKPEALKRGSGGAGSEQGGAPGAGVPDHTVGLRRPDLPQQGRQEQQGRPAPGERPVQPLPGQGVPPDPAQGVPPGGGGPGEVPPSWAQQVHDLAAHAAAPANPDAPAGQPGQPAAGPGQFQQPGPGPEGVIPWRPPVSDPFLAAAQQQARPAGLGKRIAARLVDSVLTYGVVGAVAFPLISSGVEHIEQKVHAVEQAGETEQVWLIDGTTGGFLAAVIGVLLLFGLLYEVLPTARWGRTLGKKLFGLQVLDVEQQSKPDFGPAAFRWLVYSGLSLVVVGIVNVLWGVFDRPWHQCWHDKAAHTFVSKDPGDVRL